MKYQRVLANRGFSVGETDPTKIVKVMANDGKSGEPFELVYNNTKMIGNGSFGVVFQARLVASGEDAAIKKVLQDKRFKVYYAPHTTLAEQGQLTIILCVSCSFSNEPRCPTL